MSIKSSSINAPAKGFTLAELLVAMSVLSIIMVGLATIMGFVTAAWSSGLGSVDNNAKARVMLNLLDRDIQNMVMRRDLAAFVDSTGTTACAFYSNVQSYTGSAVTMDTRSISLVQYKLSNSGTFSGLQRLSYGSNFNAAGITASIGNTGTLTQLSNTTFLGQVENVATGVVAFQYQFIDGTGTILTPSYALTSTPPTTSSPPTGNTPFWFDYALPGATYNPRIVVVSMAVMSDSAYKIAVQSNTLSAATACFVTSAPAAATPIYSQAWNKAINNPSPAFLALPPRVRAGIQIFERHIPLPMTTPSL